MLPLPLLVLVLGLPSLAGERWCSGALCGDPKLTSSSPLPPFKVSSNERRSNGAFESGTGVASGAVTPWLVLYLLSMAPPLADADDAVVDAAGNRGAAAAED